VPGGQPLSQEAKAFTTSKLQGQEVGLEFDKERTDPYGRLLAYLHEGGEVFNEDLLEGGYAQVATFPPNTRYLSRFESAQERARAAGIGIWGLSPEEQAQLEDRGNGIGGDGCRQGATSPPAPSPRSAPNPAPGTGGGYAPVSQDSCPANAPIKGNQSGIYHVPGGQFYGRTNPEECFESETEAQAAGYRRSQR
jgi:micrococcal nuclease